MTKEEKIELADGYLSIANQMEEEFETSYYENENEIEKVKEQINSLRRIAERIRKLVDKV